MDRLDLPWWSAFPIAAGIAIGVLVGSVVVWNFLEMLVRPMLHDIASHLPPDYEVSEGSWSLLARALLPLPLVASFVALTTGAFVDLVPPGPARMALVLGISVSVMVVTVPIFLVITRSILEPLGHLTRAIRRVSAGDLAHRAPLLTDDELSVISQDFNRMVADLQVSRDELQASRQRIVAATDAERRRMERDLHDGAQQNLSVLNLKLGVLRRELEGQPASERIGEIQEDVTRALSELRDLAHGIYPAVLENEGLPAALREAASRSAIEVAVDADAAKRYPPELEAAIYFCCLEALQNAAKHAGEGATAGVRLAQENGEIRFEVTDDGVGYDAESTPPSTGLQNMADRIGALGGVLRVKSKPGGGVAVLGAVPVGGHR